MARMSFVNPSHDEICDQLAQVRTIAVIGLSPKETRPSFRIARAMQQAGFRIIPVRPLVGMVLGETAYSQLSQALGPVDLVNVFRAAAHVDAIVDDCIAQGIRRLWIQEGIVNEPAALRARAAGIWVVMDRCIWRDYAGLCLPRRIA
jgi:predicted CoA-binding protein